MTFDRRFPPWFIADDRLDQVERLARGLEIEARLDKLGYPRATRRHHDEPGRVLHRGPECWGDTVWVVASRPRRRDVLPFKFRGCDAS